MKSNQIFELIRNGELNKINDLFIPKKFLGLKISNKSITKLTDNNENTPLHIASISGYNDIVKLLLVNQAQVNSLNGNRHTPLFLAVSAGHIDVVKTILDYDVDVNIPDKVKATTLHEASRLGHLEISKLLIAKGANIDSLDNGGHTPLFKAVSHGHLKVVESLIDGGANVNVVAGKYNFTPLSSASNHGYIDIVKILIKNGADPTIGGYYKNAITTVRYGPESPLIIASDNGHNEIVKLVKQAINSLDSCQYCNLKGLYSRNNSGGMICDDCAQYSIAREAEKEYFQMFRKNQISYAEMQSVQEKTKMLKYLYNSNKENYELFFKKYLK